MNNELKEILEQNRFRVSIDTRSLKDGEIYFALRGESFNGNMFAEEALSKGAKKCVIDDLQYSGKDRILVDNVLKELHLAARYYRERFDIPVLAITGSNGKTTSKELISRVLSKKYKIHYTRGNLNNHIGLPITILSAPADSEFLLLEMGANHIGEIKELCEIANPDAGLITNIGRAHLEGFGSFKGVINAKTELYDYIESVKGRIFYNEMNEVLVKSLENREIIKIPYSKPGFSEIKILNVKQSPQLVLGFKSGVKEYLIESNLFGRHNLENVLAALAVGIYYEVDLTDIIDAIESYMPDNNRSQVLNTGKNTIVCDSYNANPESMRLAIESFSEAEGSRLTAILGDMKEMGEFSESEHRKVIELVLEKEDISLMLVGEIFSNIAPEYAVPAFEGIGDLFEHLSNNPIKDSFVLVKGSRAIGLEKIYSLL